MFLFLVVLLYKVVFVDIFSCTIASLICLNALHVYF